MISTEETIRRVGRIIAATRFPFIDQEDWDTAWGVYTNDYMEEQLIIERARHSVSDQSSLKNP